MIFIEQNWPFSKIVTSSNSVADVPTLPGKPEIIKTDSTHIGLKWSPPEFDGDNSIIAYLIEKREELTAKWIRVEQIATETDFTATDLYEGKTYKFRVAAINKIGIGPFSEPSDPAVCKPLSGKL